MNASAKTPFLQQPLPNATYHVFTKDGAAIGINTDPLTRVEYPLIALPCTARDLPSDVCGWKMTWVKEAGGYGVIIANLTMDTNCPSNPTYLIAQGDQPTGRIRGCCCDQKVDTDSDIPINNDEVCGPLVLLPIESGFRPSTSPAEDSKGFTMKFRVGENQYRDLSVEEKESDQYPGRRLLLGNGSHEFRFEQVSRVCRGKESGGAMRSLVKTTSRASDALLTATRVDFAVR